LDFFRGFNFDNFLVLGLHFGSRISTQPIFRLRDMFWDKSSGRNDTRSEGSLMGFNKQKNTS